ncbi:hypothetical protein GCM10019059_07590 [Camelimonas fluminis]|uniref:Uncharacterized protein n=1 Tax=Camelimonas fluminis TaxID=1576911 RepID=A0ABV7UEQ0_9HYPH|nr:hypothetical protein [Camelimonas fluminis]GHE50925.1 hypothetical protein GCM10019059_07590 [Camelimonas fluminis]
MAKTTIDIEALLHWAYGVQRVDRWAAQADRDLAGPSLSSSDMAGVAALGVRVQSSGRWLTSMGAKIADDAVTVHDAVLALDDMFCETQRDGAVRIWLRDEIVAAGMDVRNTAHGPALVCVSALSGRVDWSDARPVSKAVTSVLVIQHARITERPECYADVRRPASRPASSGGVDAHGRKRAVRSGPSWESVIAARAEYHVWHCALSALAAKLADRLAFYSPQPPSAPASPWIRDRRPGQNSPSRTKVSGDISHT